MPIIPCGTQPAARRIPRPQAPRPQAHGQRGTGAGAPAAAVARSLMRQACNGRLAVQLAANAATGRLVGHMGGGGWGTQVTQRNDHGPPPPSGCPRPGLLQQQESSPRGAAEPPPNHPDHPIYHRKQTRGRVPARPRQIWPSASSSPPSSRLLYHRKYVSVSALRLPPSPYISFQRCSSCIDTMSLLVLGPTCGEAQSRGRGVDTARARAQKLHTAFLPCPPLTGRPILAPLLRIVLRTCRASRQLSTFVHAPNPPAAWPP